RGDARADGRTDARPCRVDIRGCGTRRGARGTPGAPAVTRRGLPRAHGRGRGSGGRDMSVEAIRVSGRRPPRALFVHQLRSEQLVFWRSREAAFFIFLFPLLLFVLLGSVYSGKIYGFPAAEYLLTGLIGYGCANTAFAGLAIQLVLRRENGILKRLRSTPLPPATYVMSLLVSTLIVFALQTLALFLLGRSLYGTPFPSDWFSFVAAIVIGAAVFAALGTATASVIRSAEGSSAGVDFILLPLA